MATWRPFTWINGKPTLIPTGDTIDPAFIPGGGGGSGSDTFAFFMGG